MLRELDWLLSDDIWRLQVLLDPTQYTVVFVFVADLSQPIQDFHDAILVQEQVHVQNC